MKQIRAAIPLVTRKSRLFAWNEGFVFIFDDLVGWRFLPGWEREAIGVGVIGAM